LTRTVNSGIPDDVISFSASAAGRAFILTGAYNKMYSSDLSYEHELGEVGEGGEVDEGPLQQCRKLTTSAPRLTRECPSLSIATR
jgi:hypothetical protein